MSETIYLVEVYLLDNITETGDSATVTTSKFKNEVYMKNKAKRSDNEHAQSNDSDIALNGFLDLLDHDITTNADKLVEVTEVHNNELEQIIGDYQIDLEGKY